MVAFLEARGVEGATVLEIGGGVGEIQIELLERGAARTVNLELSPGYDDVAAQLLRERGFSKAVQRRLQEHEQMPTPESIEPADVRRPTPRRLLLPGLRATARSGCRARTARRRVQLPAAQRAVTRVGRRRDLVLE